MANQQYQQIKKETTPLWFDGCPILLEAHALYRDTNAGCYIAQLKWKNISPKIIDDVMVEVEGIDSFRKPTQRVTFQYTDINAKYGDEFGDRNAITIQEKKIVEFNVFIKAISFTDGSIWQNDHEKKFEALPKEHPISISDELQQQYIRDLEKHGLSEKASAYKPQEYGDLWQCGCGSWQPKGMACVSCKASSIDKFLGLDDSSALAQHLADYKKALEEEAQQKEKEAREKAEQDRIKAERIKKEKEEKAFKQRKIAFIAIIAVVAIAIIAVVVTQVILPKSNYDNGIRLAAMQKWDEAVQAFEDANGYSDSATKILATRYAEGESKRVSQDWDGAIAAFEQAADYSDAPIQIKETYYQAAAYYYSSQQYDKAYSTYAQIKEYKDVSNLLQNDSKLIEAATAAKKAAHDEMISKLRTIGGTVEFGRYEQDGDSSNGTEPIEWIVLDVKDDAAFLVSSTALFYAHYQPDLKISSNWGNSDLRKNLNQNFYNQAFTEEEQGAILTATVDNSYKQGYKDGFSGGEDTKDNVFILSFQEVLTYFPTEYSRCCLPSTTARNSRGKYFNNYGKHEGSPYCIWWTRSPGVTKFNSCSEVMSFNQDGTYFEYTGVNYEHAVRPAIYIDLTSDNL